MSGKETKEKIGRPTKYKPEFCDMVIEMGKTGASKHEMALELDIAMSTFTLWQDQIEEFSASVKKAVEFSQGWWEKNGRIATFGGHNGFNPTTYIFNMKNRFKEDWRDKVESEIKQQTETSLKESDREILKRFIEQQN